MAARAREGGWEQQQKGRDNEEELEVVAQEEEVWEQEGGKPREDNGTIAEEQQRLVERQLAEFIRHMVSQAQGKRSNLFALIERSKWILCQLIRVFNWKVEESGHVGLGQSGTQCCVIEPLARGVTRSFIVAILVF